ncbi:hypothetical protein COEREDRAFT_11654 [Coemansia reversa NRRL 1564]|uniref:Uncharacterized protein n=1 Tax=Coemansia reversa (strain ATCC 12441 / NRRL 1564) TaxID=763665 RepID=A0A2G5B3E1_COERN|nr:hypothetical protein COEREDRAFT_11654 [Coemansia reversa NRRL 1564]|eukprot:PIA13227.1 hypothetical protein COEREDRAFT_11654 [Coemansia reversa NRRL 1564]
MAFSTVFNSAMITAVVGIIGMSLSTNAVPVPQQNQYQRRGYSGMGAYGGINPYGGFGYNTGFPFATSFTNAFNADSNFATFNDDTIYANNKDATTACNNVNKFNSANVIA